MLVLWPLVLRALGGGLRRLLLGLVYLVQTRLVLGSCNIQHFIHIHMKRLTIIAKERNRCKISTQTSTILNLLFLFNCCHSFRTRHSAFFNSESVALVAKEKVPDRWNDHRRFYTILEQHLDYS